MQGDYMRIAHVWQEKELNTKEALDVALDNYRILFAYHSNALENCGVSVHQTREIFENGKVTNYTGDLRALFETQNQKEAYEKISEDVVKQVQVTPEWICRLHEILCHDCYDETRWSQGERPGTYKKHFYGVGLDAGLPPEDVAKEINFLCGEIARVPFFNGTVESAENLLIAAAYFHLNFEYIHPYADGNGRVGRTVLNYFLMTHGLPPTILFEEDKEIYYQCLVVFDKTQKLDGFVAFLQEQTIKTWMQQRQSKTKGAIQVICL